MATATAMKSPSKRPPVNHISQIPLSLRHLIITMHHRYEETFKAIEAETEVPINVVREVYHRAYELAKDGSFRAVLESASSPDFAPIILSPLTVQEHHLAEEPAVQSFPLFRLPEEVRRIVYRRILGDRLIHVQHGGPWRHEVHVGRSWRYSVCALVQRPWALS